MFEYNGHIHVYSPGAGADNPLLSICSYLASFLPLHDIFLFFPIQMHGRPKLTLPSKGQGHPRVMIYTNFVKRLMFHAKFQNHRPSDSEEDDF